MIRESIADGIVDLVIDAPPVNALNLKDIASLVAHLTSYQQDERVRVVVLRGEGRGRIYVVEPTGELDAASAGLVYEVIGELAREHGCTTVLVSHDVESTAIADRTVRVRDGRVSEEAGRGDAESLVVARGGWVRLPEELLVRARIGSRAKAELGEAGIVVSAAGEESKERSQDGDAPSVRFVLRSSFALGGRHGCAVSGT